MVMLPAGSCVAVGWVARALLRCSWISRTWVAAASSIVGRGGWMGTGVVLAEMLPLSVRAGVLE